jgi:hypothetical protein
MFATVYNTTKNFNENFLAYKALPNKLILITEDYKIPLWWYGLTSHFRNRLDVLENYNVLKFAVIEHKMSADIASLY